MFPACGPGSAPAISDTPLSLKVDLQSEQFCSDTAPSVHLSCPIRQTVRPQASPTSGADQHLNSACAVTLPPSAGLRATRFQLAGDSEFHDMQIHSPAFHGEYWVYVLAALVMVVFGTLLYTVDGPIKFSGWFCRSFALASTSDDARIGLCSSRPAVRPPTPEIGADGVACPSRQCILAKLSDATRIAAIERAALPKRVIYSNFAAPYAV